MLTRYRSLRADVSAGHVVSACKSPPPVQSQRPEPAAWAMESPELTADAELNYYRLRSGIDRITG